MRTRRFMPGRDASGQALVETVLLMPLLLGVLLNAINFAFFFLMALNLTSSARSSGIYSIMGGATPASPALPLPGPTTSTTSVWYVVQQDLTGAVYSPSTSNTGAQICTPSVRSAQRRHQDSAIELRRARYVRDLFGSRSGPRAE